MKFDIILDKQKGKVSSEVISVNSANYKSVTFNFKIVEGTAHDDLASYTKAYLYFLKQDGTKTQNTCKIDKANKIVICDVKNNDYAYPGEIKTELHLYKNDVIDAMLPFVFYSTQTIKCDIQPSQDSVDAFDAMVEQAQVQLAQLDDEIESKLNAVDDKISELDTKINEVDNKDYASKSDIENFVKQSNVIVKNSATDIDKDYVPMKDWDPLDKRFGDKSYAPAGFGLGTDVKKISNTSANNLTGSGFYYADNTVKDLPSTGWFFLEHRGNGVTSFWQKATRVTDRKTFERLKDAGSISAWKEQEQKNDIGIWTPKITATTANGTPTYSEAEGFYQVFQNMVYLSGYLKFSTITGLSGSLRLAGLPFTVKKGTISQGISVKGTSNLINKSLYPVLQFWSPDGINALIHFCDNNSWITMDNTHLTSNTEFFVSGFYQIY